MQDENAIEAQHSPRTIKAATLMKNKPEGAAEGMPPQKTQKISHVPSPQLLETTALNLITNLPRAHSRTHPPQSGKGKQAQEKKSNVKSHTDKSSQLTQTHLEFRLLQKDPSEKQSAEISEQEYPIVKSLENTLEELKLSVEQLKRQLAQEETKLQKFQESCQKDEQKLSEKIKDAEQEIVDTELQLADQINEIKNHTNKAERLKNDIDRKTLEAKAWKVEVEQYEEESAREIMDTNLESLKLEETMWKEMVDKKSEELKAVGEVLEVLESGSNISTVMDLKKELNEKELIIRELEEDLDMENINLEDVLGLSIEQEFDALKSRYGLTLGSELEEDVSKLQKVLTSKFEKEVSVLNIKFSSEMEQILESTMSHGNKLLTLKRNNELTRKALSSSEEDFHRAALEREKVQARSIMLLQAIEDVRTNLGRL